MHVNCSAKVWGDDYRGIAKGSLDIQWMDATPAPKPVLDTATLVPAKSVNTEIGDMLLWTKECIVGRIKNLVMKRKMLHNLISV